jgi:pimeloyl-ACP methyl ester carboxylesterase
MSIGPIVLALVLTGRQPPAQWVDPSPHTSAMIHVNGVSIEYLDWGGHGDTLLFLAGLLGSAHAFDDIAPSFTRDFHVLALTRRGHGRSDAPASGYSLPLLVEDIRQFLDALKIDRVHLAGVSAGGVEAAMVAGRYPARVTSVIYLDAAYNHSMPFQARWAPRLNANPVTRTTSPFPPAEARASFEAFHCWFEQTIGPWSAAVEADTRETYLEADGRVKQFPAPLSVIQEIIASGTAAPPDYSAVRAPSLAVFAVPTHADVPGDADTSLRQRAQEFLEAVLVPMQREQIDQLRVAVPKVTIVELTGTTHMRFMVERRTEVVRAMTAFLGGLRWPHAVQSSDSRGRVRCD